MPGPDYRLSPGFHFQLGIDSAGVSFYRVQGNVQLVGNFLVRQPFGNQFKHALLPLADRFGQCVGA